MKNITLAAYALVLTTTMAMPVMADQASTTPTPGKVYSGLVTSIDRQEHVLTVRSWVFSKKSFNLGDGCTYVLLDKNSAGMDDLRAGQKVRVVYQDSHGVLIAGRVIEEPMRYEGMVKGLDANNHSLILHRNGSDKKMQIASDCQIMLRDGKAGTVGDIKVGDHVTVTYEKPGDTLTARQIAQTSVTFTGRLTAIDLETRVLKAKTTFDSKKFNVADNCAVVINGKADGHLSDLKPNEELTFSYDEINGINVVNRIAPTDAQASPVAANEPTAAK